MHQSARSIGVGSKGRSSAFSSRRMSSPVTALETIGRPSFSAIDSDCFSSLDPPEKVLQRITSLCLAAQWATIELSRPPENETATRRSPSTLLLTELSRRPASPDAALDIESGGCTLPRKRVLTEAPDVR